MKNKEHLPIFGIGPFLVVGMAVVAAIAIAVCVLLNPIVFLIFGVTCRKIDPVKFQDLPGIIMPSLGLSMFGLIGILNLI